MSSFTPQQQAEIANVIDANLESGRTLTRQLQGVAATTTSNVSSIDGRVTTLETRVPSTPILNFVTGATGIYGPFTADFSAGIAGTSTSTKTVDCSSFIGTKVPIVVLGAPRNAGGSGMAHVAWLAEVSAGTVTITAYNTSASSSFGTIVFAVVA